MTPTVLGNSQKTTAASRQNLLSVENIMVNQIHSQFSMDLNKSPMWIRDSTTPLSLHNPIKPEHLSIPLTSGQENKEKLGCRYKFL